MSTTTDQALHVELTFSREVTELPEFGKIATRAFARELRRNGVIESTDTADLLEEERIRSAWFRQRLAERDTELKAARGIILN